MTFSDPRFFLLFFPACLLGYWAIARLGRRWMVGYLVTVSLLFYAAWNKRDLVILLGSILCNFALAQLIARAATERAKSGWLVLGITLNLAALCFYKYLFPALGFAHSLGLLSRSWAGVILPLGISFFTFTQIAYLIDLRQGVASPESLGSYTLFVTFFPHLIAGPILHHREMMPQFRQQRSYRLRSDDLALGFTWFTMGFCKKTLIADRIAPTADSLFAAPLAHGLGQTWLGVLIYAMQLYFDFSGYSDMAIGLARIFSIRFPFNFNSPFKAENIAEFWQRWHMTLTHYIMAYLYTPIQKRVGEWRLDHGKKISRKAQSTVGGLTQMVLLPTMTTLLLAGVWHGAGLKFTLYGAMHGVLLCGHHAWRILVPETHPLRRYGLSRPVSIVLTFLAVVCTFVMFRAADVQDALHIYAGMLGRHASEAPGNASDWLLLAGLLAAVWLLPNTQEVLGQVESPEANQGALLHRISWKPSLPWWAGIMTVFLLCMAYCSSASTFLYFQF